MRHLALLLLVLLCSFATAQKPGCQRTDAILAETIVREHAVKALFTYLTQDIRGMTDEDLELYLSQPTLVNPVPFASQVNDTQRHVIGGAFRDELKGMREEEKSRVWEELRMGVKREAKEKKKEKEKREEVKGKTESILQPFVIQTYGPEHGSFPAGVPVLFKQGEKPMVAMGVEKGTGFYPLLEPVDQAVRKKVPAWFGQPQYFERDGKPYFLFGEKGPTFQIYDIQEEKVVDPSFIPKLNGHLWRNPVVFENDGKVYLAGANALTGKLDVYEMGKPKKPISEFAVPLPPDWKSNNLVRVDKEPLPVSVHFKGRTLLAVPGNFGDTLMIVDPITKERFPDVKLPRTKYPAAYELDGVPHIAFAGFGGVADYDFGTGKAREVDTQTETVFEISVFQSQGAAFGVAALGSHKDRIGIWPLGKTGASPVQISAPNLESDPVPFKYDGQDFITWGEKDGYVAVADRYGNVIARQKLAEANVCTVIPFQDGATIKAFIKPDYGPPSIGQLAGPIPRGGPR